MQLLLFEELAPFCSDCGIQGWIDRYRPGAIWDRVLPPAYYCPECGFEIGGE